ncbi:MAG: hypothetical protein WBN60_00195 [Polyangiales bacterium]
MGVREQRLRPPEKSMLRIVHGPPLFARSPVVTESLYGGQRNAALRTWVSK